MDYLIFFLLTQIAAATKNQNNEPLSIRMIKMRTIRKNDIGLFFGKF